MILIKTYAQRSRAVPCHRLGHGAPYSADAGDTCAHTSFPGRRLIDQECSALGPVAGSRAGMCICACCGGIATIFMLGELEHGSHLATFSDVVLGRRPLKIHYLYFQGYRDQQSPRRRREPTSRPSSLAIVQAGPGPSAAEGPVDAHVCPTRLSS